MPKHHEGPSRNKSTNFYYFDNVVGFGKDKRRLRYSLKTKDPEKARWLWEQEYTRQWSKYYGIEPRARPGIISFRDMAEEFVGYERDIKRIKEWRIQENRLAIIDGLWKNPTLSRIDKSHLVQLDRHLKSLGRSKATVNHYFTLLKSLFNYAIKEKKYAGENPIKEIVPYVTEEKRREYSPEEIEKILAAAELVEKNARRGAVMQQYARRIVLILLYTGMRTGELLHLKWDNIKDDRIVFKRTETKQKKEKVIPLTDGIKEVLESMIDDRRKNGYVIPLSPGMKERGAVWMTDLIKKIREHSGIEDFIFHNIRHTVATRMVSEALGRGVGIADIQKILGHSSLDTTMKYVHSDFGRMRKAMNILEEKAKKKE